MKRRRLYLIFGLPMILLLIVAACGGTSEAGRPCPKMGPRARMRTWGRT